MGTADAAGTAHAAGPEPDDPISGFLAGLADAGRLATFGDASATLRFDISNGAAPEHWYLTVLKGRVAVTRDDRPADAVLHMRRPHFEAMVTGRLNAQAAMLRGLLICEGSMAACAMFQRCLPGPPGSTGRVAPIPAQIVNAERRPA